MNAAQEMQLIDTQTAAPLVGLAPQTLRQLRCKGNGPPFYKIGRAVRYDRAELFAWVASHRVDGQQAQER